jgi:hypothetical protein
MNITSQIPENTAKIQTKQSIIPTPTISIFDKNMECATDITFPM